MREHRESDRHFDEDLIDEIRDVTCSTCLDQIAMQLRAAGRRRLVVCPVCGDEFVAYHRRRTYCRPLCAQRAKKRRQRTRDREAAHVE